ncbi:MAG: flagellar filament capping protein FliD [Rhodocyclaceae bacterium]|nr:flagellar filament capping protein FliD [Rhodocyclaceae bacterium]
MASVTSAGVGSGLDINGIIAKLMAAERGPLTKLESKETLARTRLSELGTLKSLLSTLETSVEAFDNSTEAYSYTASVAQATVGGVATTVATASGASTASVGNYSLEVEQLAVANKLKSTAGADPSSGGTLTIDVGSVSGGVFTQKSGTSSVAVTIAAGSTLAQMRDAINASTALVNATIVTGASGSELVITSDNTGTSDKIKIVSTVSSGTFGYAPVTATGLTQQTAALDAIVKIDGTTLANTTSNTITNAVTGVTLTLLATNDNAATTLSVANDPAALTTKLNTFVSAYNALAAKVKTLTKYDSTSGISGYFNGDQGITRVMTQIRDAIFSTPAGVSSSYTSMSSLGVRFGADGTLSLNTAILTTASSSDFAAVAQTIGAYGAAMDTAADNMLSTTGIMATKNTSLTALITALDKDQATAERRLSSLEKRYRAQFTALDVLISNMQTTSSFLSRQLANL